MEPIKPIIWVTMDLVGVIAMGVIILIIGMAIGGWLVARWYEDYIWEHYPDPKDKGFY